MSPGTDDGPQLSKSRYAAGLQCARRLWFQVYAAELAGPPEASRVAVLEAGRELGRRARALFPGGLLVEESAERHAEAVARTRSLLEEASAPALFEAAFEYQGIRIRVDVLERLERGAFGLREVKSSTSLRDEHLDDVVIQLYVLRGCGVRVPSVELILVNGAYVRDAGGVDWSRFFARSDVTRDVEFLLPDVKGQLPEMRATLARDPASEGAPTVEPSPHCRRPALCEFWSYCTSGAPADGILYLPGIRSTEFHALRARRIARIADIPDDFPLNERQARARAAHRAGGESIAPRLAQMLRGSGPPGAYLDFETTSPPVPAYAGTRPYQRIPYQWSLHRADVRGAVSHQEFLARGRADPRREFVERLLEALGRDGLPVLVYSSYESEVLGELCRALPDLAEDLGVVRRRLFDLLPVVRSCIYAPAFAGSFSLKRVIAALEPGFGYDDLDGIASGGEAAVAIARLLRGGVAAGEAESLRASLRAYCRRDTEALVALHRALCARAAG